MANEKQALGMTMQISQEFIDNLAENIVSESLMATLGGSDKFVHQIISQILSVKVDPKTGQVTSWRDGIPYLNYMINKTIREEVSETVKEIMEEKRPEIRKVIKSELMKKDTVDKFFKAFTNSVIDGMDKSWKTTINVSFGDGE